MLKERELIIREVHNDGYSPHQKNGKHSALNMFDEYSMTLPQQMAPYMGFTAEEVMAECDARQLKYSSFQKWYDGYRLSNVVSDELVIASARTRTFVAKSPKA